MLVIRVPTLFFVIFLTLNVENVILGHTVLLCRGGNLFAHVTYTMASSDHSVDKSAFYTSNTNLVNSQTPEYTLRPIADPTIYLRIIG